MTTYWDASALLAAVIGDEPHHESCAAALAVAREAWTTPHALAECFATLTGGRRQIQLTPADTFQVIEVSLVPRLQLYTLKPEDYLAVMRQAHSSGVRGGAIYDLLHLHAARQIGAQRIFTLNVRHFQAFAPDLARCIGVP